MERDGVLAHGMSYFLNESFMVRGDEYFMAVCNKTGTIAIYNQVKNLFLSTFSDGPINFHTNPDGTMNIKNLSRFGRDFSILRIPYSFKLLIHELQVMNVQMRIITEENIDQLSNMNYSTNINKLLKVDENDTNLNDMLRDYQYNITVKLRKFDDAQKLIKVTQNNGKESNQSNYETPTYEPKPLPYELPGWESPPYAPDTPPYAPETPPYAPETPPYAPSPPYAPETPPYTPSPPSVQKLLPYELPGWESPPYAPDSSASEQKLLPYELPGWESPPYSKEPPAYATESPPIVIKETLPPNSIKNILSVETEPIEEANKKDDLLSNDDDDDKKIIIIDKNVFDNKESKKNEL
jgi:hypothetical protein